MSPDLFRCSAGAVSAAALLVCLAAQAQNTTPRPARDDATGSVKRSAAKTVAPMAVGDRRFIEEAAMGGLAEVELGKLAQIKGASEQVKQFGARMVEDRGPANMELKQLAQIKGLSVPAAPARSHAREMGRLSRLSGPEFDRQYMAYTLSDHRKDVWEFKKAAEAAKDSDVKAFADKTLPTLQEHLRFAQAVHDGVQQTR